MFTWEIATGKLLNDRGELVAVGYSGKDHAKNNPAMQDVHNLGPIPEGNYTIQPPVDTVTHGPYVLPLTPDPLNEMHGRSGFLMHGDSKVDPGNASEGCIILSRQERESVWASHDRQLHVISQVTEDDV